MSNALTYALADPQFIDLLASNSCRRFDQPLFDMLVHCKRKYAKPHTLGVFKLQSEGNCFRTTFDMALILDIMPDVLVTIMGILGLIRAKRFQNAFSAIAALFGVDEIRLYSDVELFVGQHWDDIFAALDVHARGRQYFGSFC